PELPPHPVDLGLEKASRLPGELELRFEVLDDVVAGVGVGNPLRERRARARELDLDHPGVRNRLDLEPLAIAPDEMGRDAVHGLGRRLVLLVPSATTA